jgi:hypothetical protein
MKKQMTTLREHIIVTLSQLHPSEAISLVESIGKELRRKNSIRISKGNAGELLNLDRPDLETLKAKRK